MHKTYCLRVLMLNLLRRIMPFYSVASGRQVGVFNTWADCESQVKGFSGAVYKKFNTLQEAETFITSKNGGPTQVATSSYSRKASRSPLFSNGSSSKRPASKTSLSEHMAKRTKLIDPIAQTKQYTENISKMERHGDYDFLVDNDGYVHVYTDGSCENNGKKKALAGLGVYFGEGHELNMSDPVVGPATNNRGEIQAATKAIELSVGCGIKKLCVNTDSQFLINSVTKWLPGWKAKGWRLATGQPVKNETDFRALDQTLRDNMDLHVKWSYVPAHSGILGNERADELAKIGAQSYKKTKK